MNLVIIGDKGLIFATGTDAKTRNTTVLLLLCLFFCLCTESSSPSDVLRAKVMVEFVLSSFSAHSEDASLLSKGKQIQV